MNHPERAWKLLAATWLAIVTAACILAGCSGCAVRTQTRVEHTVTRVEAFDNTDALYRALKATVTIQLPDSCGSGALVARNVILTAAHVVEHEGKIVIEFFDGKVFTASVVKLDALHDLALLVFDGHSETAPLMLAMKTPRIMESVWNFGAPGCMPGHASRGLWSWMAGKNRMLVGGFEYPGMSGGPVIDESGALVGINDAVWVPNGNDPVPQMGQVVDYADVKRFMQ